MIKIYLKERTHYTVKNVPPVKGGIFPSSRKEKKIRLLIKTFIFNI